MNWKLIVVGGLVYYAVTMIVGIFVTGPLIHEGLLEAPYRANQEFWRPELNQDPPDIGALMPRWLAAGLINALVIAAIFAWMRPTLGGSDLKAGVKYGLFLSLFGAMFALAWSGIFDLPDTIWLWWTIDGLMLNILGCAAMGWVGQRLAA